MVYFQTKNPNLGKFCRVLQWMMLVYFMSVSSILQPYAVICFHLVYFKVCFFPFGYFVPRKIWQPCFREQLGKLVQRQTESWKCTFDLSTKSVGQKHLLRLFCLQCYDHNFRRFLPIFVEKVGIFLENQCYDHMFAKTSSTLSKNANIFA
jgi:hypothetical protein